MGQNCSNIFAVFNYRKKGYKVNFESKDKDCLINLYQNDRIKEICGNATDENGFNMNENLYQNFYMLNLPVFLFGLD